MKSHSARRQRPQPQAVQTEFYTVAEAASELGVSVSTIWRWIDAGRMPAFRLGPKAIRIRRSDARAALQPVGGRIDDDGGPTVYDDPDEAKRPLTDDEVARARAAMAAADELRAAIRQRRHGKPLPSSAPLIREARDKRSPFG